MLEFGLEEFYDWGHVAQREGVVYFFLEKNEFSNLLNIFREGWPAGEFVVGEGEARVLEPAAVIAVIAVFVRSAGASVYVDSGINHALRAVAFQAFHATVDEFLETVILEIFVQLAVDEFWIFLFEQKLRILRFAGIGRKICAQQWVVVF